MAETWIRGLQYAPTPQGDHVEIKIFKIESIFLNLCLGKKSPGFSNINSFLYALTMTFQRQIVRNPLPVVRCINPPLERNRELHVRA